MDDWYDLKDPRQFYYSTYTVARARQQDTADANFTFVESRGLGDMLPEDVRRVALNLLVPLRHAAWGANQNNTLVCGYGYGVTFTQPCMYHAMDNLGIAQYLSRLGLLLGDVQALEAAKAAWLTAPAWQPLRRYVEDTLVVRDPFELFVAQNVALDGLLYPPRLRPHRRRRPLRPWRRGGGAADPVHDRLVRRDPQMGGLGDEDRRRRIRA